MKNFKYAFAALALVFAFTSCNDDKGLKGPDVVVEATSISISPEEVTVVWGKTFNLNITVTPENATTGYFAWTVADPTIVAVEGKTITGIGIGSTTITATTPAGLTASCNVTVIAPEEPEHTTTTFTPAASLGLYYGDMLGAADAGFDVDYNLWLVDFADQILADGDDENGTELQIWVCSEAAATELPEGRYELLYGYPGDVVSLLQKGTLMPFLSMGQNQYIGTCVVSGGYYTNYGQSGWLEVSKNGSQYSFEFEILTVDGKNSTANTTAYAKITGSYTGDFPIYDGNDIQ